MRIDIPEYDKALDIFTENVLEGFISLDQFFGQIPQSQSTHSGPIRNVRGEQPLDQPLMNISFSANLPIEAIRQTDVNLITVFLYDLAQSCLAELTRSVISNLGRITDITGNEYDARGKQFTFDMINDILEIMAIDFDDHDQPILPSVLIPSKELVDKIKATKPTEEEEKRYKEIIENKRKEFHAKKRTRRLSQ
jgi:hypothetical protein